MSTFGKVLRVTTFGESHGAGVGCVIDGLPGAQRVCLGCIRRQLARRRPGGGFLCRDAQQQHSDGGFDSPVVLGCTPRFEADEPKFLSGVEDGLSLGTPICILIENTNVRRQDYALVAGSTEPPPEGNPAHEEGAPEQLSAFPRPGHAELTYLIKFGICSRSGGGRSSARETAARVAAAALVESSLLRPRGIEVVAFVCSVGEAALPPPVRRALLEDGTLSRDAIDSEGEWTFDLERNLCRQSLLSAVSEWEEATLDESVCRSLREKLATTQRNPPESLPRSRLCRVVTRCPHKSTSFKIAKTLLEVRKPRQRVSSEVAFCLGLERDSSLAGSACAGPREGRQCRVYSQLRHSRIAVRIR